MTPLAKKIAWALAMAVAIVAAFVLLTGAGPPTRPKLADPVNYARAGFETGVVYQNISTTTVRIGCFGNGAAATIRGPAALTLCWASDPSATIGAQGVATTADDVISNSVTYSGCNGKATLAGEPADVIPDFEFLAARPRAWTGTFCTGRIDTPHGLMHPSCRVDADCTATLGLAGTTCTRTSYEDSCVHLFGIEAGSFESASGWR